MTPGRVRTMPRNALFAPVALAALFTTCSAAAWARDGMQEVPVSDFTIPPAGDLRLIQDRLELHPLALLGVGWISDVDPVTRRGTDTYERGLVGLLARYLPNPDWNARFEGELERVRYNRFADQDATIGRMLLGGDYTGVGFWVKGSGGWTSTQDAVVISGEQVLRDDYDLTLIGHRQVVADWWEEAALEWNYLDYRDATSLFNADEADHTTWSGDLRVGSGEREDQYWFAGHLEFVDYPSGPRFNDCRAVIASAGRRWPLGPRTSLHAEGGVIARFYADDFLKDPAFDDRTVIWPKVDVGAEWDWEESSHIAARAFSTANDSLGSNAETSYGLAGDMRLRLLRRCALVAGLSLSHDRSSGAPAGETVPSREVANASIALQYEFAVGLSAHVRFLGSHVDSSNGESYNREQVSADLAYAY